MKVWNSRIYNTLTLPGRGLWLIESESFLIVNFKWNSTFYLARDFLELRIQVHTKSKYTKNISIYCAGLHLFYSRLDNWPGPFLIHKSHCCTAPFIFGILCFLPGGLYQSFYLSAWFLPEISSEYLISTRNVIGVLDFYQSSELQWSTGFPYIYQNFIVVPYVYQISYIYQNFIGVLYVYQISLYLPELHRSTLYISDFLISTRTSSEYFMYTRYPYI